MNDDTVRKEVTEAFNAKLKELTGADSLDALQAKNLARRGEIDVQMSRFIKKHNESLARLLLAGHPDYPLTKTAPESG